MVSFHTDFPHLKFIDLGGGLGVQYQPVLNNIKITLDYSSLININEDEKSDEDLFLNSLREGLHRLKNMLKENGMGSVELWMEPGRYLVAEMGVLGVEVTQTKRKGSHDYVGVNSGMNSLIRPALYDAYHHAVNLSRMEEPHDHVIQLVGPICESGDILNPSLTFPITTKDPDLVMIATVGAYGFTMSSNYNVRPNGIQYLLDLI